MEDIAAWAAPIATMLAACVTAANLGARVTGWGFVIFTIGSVSWSAYAMATDQPNLLWQNVFLTVVNLVGVWRWLGRQARFDDGAQAAAEKSERKDGPTLFPVSMLTAASVEGRGGEAIGTSVDAMARCEDGRISYLVVSAGGVGGVGERLHALPWSKVSARPSGVTADIDAGELERLAPIEPTNWPTAAPPAARS
ncbi:PRC-barrel domain-containing protein [Sphingosinicella sp. BN140058]|uniref:PRC-barrel domain-containing protein n=1 Tax=Sphingosinicella sp. BN140058 TaxID=1892855 RepID=UPI001012EB3B|nr:PRC-barrel domain-containing protein [Sphingosinicella sp. BN140058]QAY79417.1 PRC-barrel domain containing protein [Sphingosinicella sp. BN140058]